MKVTLVWNSPNPEKTIAIAMRRCYSTKPIEEIDSELEQKGVGYWKHLIVRSLQDKALDVIEHYRLELLLEDLSESEIGRIARNYPFINFLQLHEKEWLASMNARTLVEMWRDGSCRDFAKAIVDELNAKSVSPTFNALAFGE